MKKKQDKVTAVIELRITPAKDTGFAKIAQRIARFLLARLGQGIAQFLQRLFHKKEDRSA